MPTNPNDLLSWADCDTAKTKLEDKLDGRQVRDINLDYADRQADRSSSRVAQRLASANARVTSYTTTLAQPDLLGPDRLRAQLGLITATAERDKLQLTAASETGADVYLDDVEAEQIDRDVTFLTGKLAEVAARRAQLTA